MKLFSFGSLHIVPRYGGFLPEEVVELWIEMLQREHTWHLAVSEAIANARAANETPMEDTRCESSAEKVLCLDRDLEKVLPYIDHVALCDRLLLLYAHRDYLQSIADIPGEIDALCEGEGDEG